MKSEKNFSNLEELLIFLMQDQLNDESSDLIKEILSKQNFENNNMNLTRSLLTKNISKNIKNISQKYKENILEKLNNLDFIELNDSKEEITFKADNILNVLFYPRYCYYINNKYGPNCLKFFEYLLEYGFYQENVNTFLKKDFASLIRDEIILIIKDENKKNENLFNIINWEKYKINFKLLNEIMFKEYFINFYKKYISMNFQFYDLFKKVVNSNNYIYELKNHEKNIISKNLVDNFDFGKLLIKVDNDDNKLTLNKDIIKYDLFYNSVEKIINLFYSSKHLRILKIIELNENLNIYQISQKACLKHLEVQEIIEELINKLKIVKKIKTENNKEDFIYLLNEIDESIINMMKDNIYGIIKNIKFELKDKLKQLQGKIDQDTVLQYINKYYSFINTFSEILNVYNFIFN